MLNGGRVTKGSQAGFGRKGSKSRALLKDRIEKSRENIEGIC